MHSGKINFNHKKQDILILISRLYLLKSPAVRGESPKFQKKDLTGIIQEVFLPCYNALRLLLQSCDQLKIEENITFTYNHECVYTNTMDIWIVSYTQTFVDFVHEEMNGKFEIIIRRIFISNCSISS